MEKIPRAANEKINASQIVVDWNNNKAVASPDQASGTEGRVLKRRNSCSDKM
jgi:hypothetical protein